MCKLRDRRSRYADSAVLEFSASLSLQGRWLTIAHPEPRFQRFAVVLLHGRHFFGASLTTGSAPNVRQRVMHDCASILDSIAKKTSCFHYFSHGASLHHCSFSRMIFTLDIEGL